MSTAIVHKAVEPGKLSVAGKKLYRLLVDSLTNMAFGAACASVRRRAILLPKYDGTYVQFGFEGGKWQALTRTGQVMKSLSPQFAAFLDKHGVQSVRYIGEAWLPNTQHSIINGLSRSHTVGALDVVLHDAYEVGGPPLRFWQRLEYLQEWGRIPRNPFSITHVVGVLPDSENDLYQMAREWTKRTSAFDGLILRDGDGYFKEGKGKDGENIKIKPRASGDFLVVGTTPGKGNRLGGIGALVVDLGGGVHCEVGTGLSAVDVHDRGAGYFVGRIVEVEYLSLTPAGLLREPSYKSVRHDKDKPDDLSETTSD